MNPGPHGRQGPCGRRPSAGHQNSERPMDMEVTAWHSLHSAMNAQQDHAAVLPEGVAPHHALRPAAPAADLPLPAAERPHRAARSGHPGAGRKGRRRDRQRRGHRHGHPAGPAHRAHRRRRGRSRSAHPLAVVDAGRGPDPGSAHRRLRPCAEDAGGLLHPDPDRRPGQPAQQRCDRRTTGLQQHTLRRRLQRRHAVADARGDAHDLLADHPALAGAAPGVRRRRPAGWASGWPDSSGRRPTTTPRWAPR